LKRIIDSISDFKKFWKNYLLQSFFAGLTIFTALIIVGIDKRPIIIASIGATAFKVFAMPNDITSQPRNILGGHFIGLIAGSLCFFIPQTTHIYAIFVYALAVAVSMFLMVVTDTEHPPASGTALSFAVAGFSEEAFLTVLVSVTILSGIHKFFRPLLKDLT